MPLRVSSRFFVRLAVVVLALAGLATSGGCGDEPKPDAAPTAPAFVPTHEVVKEAAYYRTSPAQARPPDGTLAQGMRVRLVRDGGSYAEVETPIHETVWVSTSEMKPLSR